MLIGYARVSTDGQDLTSQIAGLEALGVDAKHIHSDKGLTGRNRERPGLEKALAVCRDGDTLVVTKLDRLARSLPDARDIAEDLTQRGVKLNLLNGMQHYHIRRAARSLDARACDLARRSDVSRWRGHGNGRLSNY